MLLDAICEFELGNYNRSVDQLQRLLAMQPRNRKVRTLLAQSLYRAGNPLDALDIIREIAGRGDADCYALTTAARAFEASDQRANASAALDDAALSVVRAALPLPEPMSLAGAADEARRNPSNARAVIPYIRLLMAEGNIDAAHVEAVRLQAGNAGVADAHILMGDIEMARGNVAGAVTAYGQARAISFTEPVMLRMVDALSRRGDDKAAGEMLAAYLAYNPQSLTALRLAGYRNLDAGQWANAIVLLERVRARVGYNDSILLANLARAYSGSGKHDAAVRDAAIAYRIAPANMMVTRTYANVLRKSGKRPKAARELAAKVRAQSVQREYFSRIDPRSLHLRLYIGPDVFHKVVAFEISEFAGRTVGNEQADTAFDIDEAAVLKQLICFGDGQWIGPLISGKSPHRRQHVAFLICTIKDRGGNHIAEFEVYWLGVVFHYGPYCHNTVGRVNVTILWPRSYGQLRMILAGSGRGRSSRGWPGVPMKKKPAICSSPWHNASRTVGL